MTTRCERESEVARALRAGGLSFELRDHVLKCTICAETQTAAGLMLEAASLLRAEDRPSSAGLIWRRAEVRKKEIAVKCATRPLIVMRILGVVYAVLCGAWFLRYVWRSNSARFLPDWYVPGSEKAYMASLIALVTIAVGAWYMLHDSRRSDAGVSSS
jgi:hypothetical protein